MKMLFEVPELEFTEINTSPLTTRKLRLLVARLDKLHPVVSGNKLFKLHYFFEKARQQEHKNILTFSGAWSNHLVATAYCCKLAGLNSYGIVRGERPERLSGTLKECLSYGMQLRFITREEYKKKGQLDLQKEQYGLPGQYFVIPEGGYHSMGAKGASLIMDLIAHYKATHICTAVGTATTLAGLMQNRLKEETVIAVPVLKNMADIHERVAFLNQGHSTGGLEILDEYTFGGYAKMNAELIDFMNTLYTTYELPTDFIYTAKMMYAVTDKIKQGYFNDGSKIICLHTGGLQGNTSLPAGTLVY